MTPSTLTRRVLAALALVSLLALLFAEAASATHVRPKGATPLRVPLVPAQQQCISPNGQHEPPLEHVRSCLPPLQTASAATVGTPDVNGFPSQSEAYVRIDVINAVTTAEDDRVIVEITDVRELATPANDYNPYPTGPDMTLVAQIPAPPSSTTGGICCACQTTATSTGTGWRRRHHGRLRLPYTRRLQLHAPRNRQHVWRHDQLQRDPSWLREVRSGQSQPQQADNRDRPGPGLRFGVDKVRGTNDDTLFAVQGIWNP